MLSAQLQVLPAPDPDQAVQDIFAGPGVEISNVTVRLKPEAFGVFTHPQATMGLQRGLILSNGEIEDVPGPNDYPPTAMGTNNEFPGDPDLARLAGTALDSTYDATVLEFDFRTTSDTLRFEYVFSSEEYPDFAPRIENGDTFLTTFNDVFAFFLTGPGITGQQNLARLPGTDIPVGVNTVNAVFNAAYYIPNTDSTTSGYDHLALNGLTSVLTAEFFPLQPCRRYHIKLALQDVGDPVMDSGVFLAAGSFRSPVDGLEAYAGASADTLAPIVREGCGTGGFRLRRQVQTRQRARYFVLFEGTATYGTDYVLEGWDGSSLLELNPGETRRDLVIRTLPDAGLEPDETIILTLRSAECDLVRLRDTLMLADLAPLRLEARPDTVVCPGAQVPLYARTQGGSGQTQATWFTMAPGPVELSTPFIIATRDTVVYLEMRDTCPGLPPVRDTVRIDVQQDDPGAPELDWHIRPPADTLVCRGQAVTWRAEVQGGTGNYTYRWDSAGRFLAQGPVLTLTPDKPGTCRLEVQDGCSRLELEIRFAFHPVPMAEAGGDTTICRGSPLERRAEVSGGWPPLEVRWWGPGFDTTATRLAAVPTAPGRVYLEVRDACPGSGVRDSFRVDFHPPLRLEPPLTDTTVCPGALLRYAVQAEGGLPPYSIEWFRNGTSAGSGSQVNITPDSDTELVVLLEDACPASGGLRDTARIGVWSAPEVRILPGETPTVCRGDSLRLTASVRGGRRPYTYRWRGTFFGQDSQFVVAPMADTLIQLTVRDQCTEVARAVSVRVADSETLVVSGDTTICHGSPALLTARLVPSSGTIVWTHPDGDTLATGTTYAPNLRADTRFIVRAEGRCTDQPLIREVEVKVLPPLAVEAGGDTTLCPGQSLRLEARGTGGKRPDWQFRWFNPAGAALGADNPLVILPAVSGDYAVELSDGCSDIPARDSLRVTLRPGDLALVLHPVDTPICPGASVRLRAEPSRGTPPYRYSWNGGPYGPDSTRLFTPAQNTPVRVSVRDQCSQVQAQSRIEVQPQPVLSPPADTAVCPNGPFRLQLREPVGLEGAEVRWTGPNGFTCTQRVCMLNPPAAGVYRVEVQGGCVSAPWADSLLITHRAVPVLEVPGDTAVCAGSSLVLGSRGVPADPDTRLRWETPTGEHLTDGPDLALRPQTSADYVAVLEHPCTTLRQTVRVAVVTSDPPLEAEIQPRDTLVCIGTRLVLRATVSGGQGAYSYHWQGPQLERDSTQRVQPLTVTQAGSYRLQVTDDCGPVRDSIRVDVHPPLQVALGRDTAVCLGQSLTITPQVRGGDGTYSYQWQVNGTEVSQAPALTYTPTVPAEVVLTVFDGCGARVRDTLALRRFRPDPPLQMATLTADTAICPGDALPLQATVRGGTGGPYTYLWSATPGGIVSDQPNWTASPTETTEYRLEVSDGCTARDTSLRVQVYAPLEVFTSGDTVICPGTVADLRAWSRGGDGRPQYTWRWAGGTVQGRELRVRPSVTTRYTVEVRDGCTPGGVSAVVEVAVAEPLDLRLPADTLLCPGTELTVEPVLQGGAGPFSYRWTTLSDSLLGTAAQLRWAASRTEIVVLEVVDACGTTRSDRMTLRLRDDQQLRIHSLTADTTVCAGERLTLQGVVTGGVGTVEVEWRDPTGQITPGQLLTFTARQSGTYTFSARDRCGRVSDSVGVTVRPPLDITLPADTLICRATGLVLRPRIRGGTPPIEYQWSGTDGTTHTGPTLVVFPENTARYTVRVEDACLSTPLTRAIEVEVYPPLTVEAQEDTLICPGAEVRLGATVAGGRPPYDLTWWQLPEMRPIGLDAANQVRPGRTTRYVALVFDGCGSAPVQDTVTVQVREGAPLQWAGMTGDTVLCAGDSVELRATVTGGFPPLRWNWQPGNATRPTLEVQPETTTTYRVAVTDACTRRDTMMQVRIWSPAEIVLPPDTLICAGQPVVLRAVVRGGPGPDLTRWTDGQGSTTPGLETTVRPTRTTTYVFSYADRCQPGVWRDSVEVAVVPPPEVEILGPDTVCPGQEVRLAVAYTGGSGRDRVAWFRIPGQSMLGSGDSLRIRADTTTAVLVEATDSCGQTVRDTLLLTVPEEGGPLQWKAVPGDTMICPDAEIEFIAELSGGSGGYTYRWLVGEDTLEGPQLKLRTAEPRNIRLEGRERCGQVRTHRFSVDVFPPPVWERIPADTLICAGQPLALTARARGGRAPLRYTWNGTPADTFRLNPRAPLTLTLAGADACGQELPPRDIQVAVRPPLSVAVEGPDSLCIGDTTRLEAVVSGGDGTYHYRWQRDTLELDTTAVVEVQPETTTQYMLTVSDGCTRPDPVLTHRIVVKPRPVLAWTFQPSTPCTSDTVTITFTGDAPPDTRFRLTLPDSLRRLGGGAGPWQVWTRTGGSYPITLEAEAAGCEAVELSSRLTFLPAPRARFTPPAPQCWSDTVFTFEAGRSGSGATYAWQFPTGDPDAATGQRADSVRFEAAGVHSVMLTVARGGCQSVAVETLELYPLPEARAADRRVCRGEPLQLNAVPQSEGWSYAWYALPVGGSPEARGRAFVPPDTDESSVWYLEATSAAGCVQRPRFPVQVSVQPHPEVEIVADPPEVRWPDGTFRFRVSSGAGLEAWSWDLDEGVTSTQATPEQSYTGPGRYQVSVQVRDTSGCRARAERWVQVLEPHHLLIPNAFTPNGEGPAENETFRVFTFGLRTFRLRVFNRYGEVIFSTRDPDFRWNGGVDNDLTRPVPEGVYVITVQAETDSGTPLSHKGTVTVVR